MVFFFFRELFTFISLLTPPRMPKTWSQNRSLLVWIIGNKKSKQKNKIKNRYQKCLKPSNRPWWDILFYHCIIFFMNKIIMYTSVIYRATDRVIPVIQCHTKTSKSKVHLYEMCPLKFIFNCIKHYYKSVPFNNNIIT